MGELNEDDVAKELATIIAMSYLVQRWAEERVEQGELLFNHCNSIAVDVAEKMESISVNDEWFGDFVDAVGAAAGELLRDVREAMHADD